MRAFTSFRYAAGSWSRPRHVIARLEVSMRKTDGDDVHGRQASVETCPLLEGAISSSTWMACRLAAPQFPACPPGLRCAAVLSLAPKKVKTTISEACSLDGEGLAASLRRAMTSQAGQLAASIGGSHSSLLPCATHLNCFLASRTGTPSAVRQMRVPSVAAGASFAPGSGRPGGGQGRRARVGCANPLTVRAIMSPERPRFAA